MSLLTVWMSSLTDQSRVYVPADSAARSVGADGVARSVEELGLPLKRPGSRGLYWLEPLLEVDSEQGRIGFGPLRPEEVHGVVDETGRPNLEHPRCLGPIERFEPLSCQQRLTFARTGIIEPTCIDQYLATAGFTGLRRALELGPQDIVDEIKLSGLRGRGGAAFPTGIKWQTVLDAPGDRKFVVCNADEGDSGTFADRMLMEGDPYCLIEGMIIAGLATCAEQGYIYLRAEYPQAYRTMQAAVSTARAHGFLGGDICGSGRRFDLELRKAAGAYICGEETAMLESLEGKRGVVRFRPPLPALKGLFGEPTVVNNVISLATVPVIMERGGEFYREFGSGDSRGTLTLQLAGNVQRGGLFEVPFGLTLREAIEGLGGGTASSRPLRAVQAGGPLGAFIPESGLDTPLDYESLKSIGAMLGHGGLVVFDDTADMGALARFAMEFCAIESCGKCTPCRIGAVRGTEVIDRIRAGEDPDANRQLLRDLCDTMVEGSLCALGGMAPYPVLSVMDHFPEDL